MSDKTSDKRLLPCPFCGGEAKLCKGYWIGKEYWVECTNCTCKTSLSNNYNETIRVWNTRKPLERIVERLEEEILEKLSDSGDDWFEAEMINKAIEIVRKEGGMNK